MTLLRSLALAFSLFSRIPMPQVEWNEKNLRYLMAAFPAVGIVIGGCVYAWCRLAAVIGLQAPLVAVGITLIPVAITGGIHLDGFADVVDARSSHAEPERKLQIMKDPHVGAFAIIGICGYLMLYAALAMEVGENHLVLLACIPVFSRCLSSYATVSLRKARKDGMLVEEGGTDHAKAVLLALLACSCLTTIVATALDGLLCIGVVAIAIVTLLLTYRMAKREFGGMTGDLAGYTLQLAELSMLAVVALMGRLV